MTSNEIIGSANLHTKQTDLSVDIPTTTTSVNNRNQQPSEAIEVEIGPFCHQTNLLAENKRNESTESCETPYPTVDPMSDDFQ